MNAAVTAGLHMLRGARIKVTLGGCEGALRLAYFLYFNLVAGGISLPHSYMEYFSVSPTEIRETVVNPAAKL
jgi:hypothetical protein